MSSGFWTTRESRRWDARAPGRFEFFATTRASHSGTRSGRAPTERARSGSRSARRSRSMGTQVQVRATVSTVEILHKGRRVIAHRRCWGPKGTATTLEEHRPKSHRDYGAWPPSRVVSGAETIGPSAAALVTHILESYPHPEDGYRKCMALIRTSKKYGAARVDAACRRALAIGSPNRKSVEMILKKGLES